MAEGLVLNENRKLVRRELIYYLKVTDRKTGLEFGRIGDLHAEGMLVLSPQPLPGQTVFKLFLELPKGIAAELGYSVLPVQAEAVWNRPGPKLSNYSENGLRFLNPPSQAQAVINLLTELFAMPNPKFQIEPIEPDVTD
jgi:hypothetical protein